MKKPIVFIFSVFWICGAQAQLFSKETNQFGEDGLRTGKWITYWDDEEKIPMSIAKFEHGRETAVSKEYHQNGKLRMKFRHSKYRIRVKHYTKERKLEQKGWARMEYTKEDVHFYWHGEWKFYGDNRKLIRTAFYENGEEVLTLVK